MDKSQMNKKKLWTLLNPRDFGLILRWALATLIFTRLKMSMTPSLLFLLACSVVKVALKCLVGFERRRHRSQCAAVLPIKYPMNKYIVNETQVDSISKSQKQSDFIRKLWKIDWGISLGLGVEKAHSSLLNIFLFRFVWFFYQQVVKDTEIISWL